MAVDRELPNLQPPPGSDFQAQTFDPNQYREPKAPVVDDEDEKDVGRLSQSPSLPPPGAGAEANALAEEIVTSTPPW